MTTILTASGRTPDLACLATHDVSLGDIAHALGHLVRFNGHTSRHYSVLEHSLLVERIAHQSGASPMERLCALLHDAHEAYIGDVASPVKALMGDAWRATEARIAHVVRKALGISTAWLSYSQRIHGYDMRALATERRDLMPHTPDDWLCLRGHPAIEPRIDSQRAPAHGELAETFVALYTELRRAADKQLPQAPAMPPTRMTRELQHQRMHELLRDLTHPEALGHAVTPEVRKRAADILALQPIEPLGCEGVA